MLPTIPITSEQYVTILKGQEKPVTGVAHAKRDDDGVMIIDDGGA